jgi:hypothetical protein
MFLFRSYASRDKLEVFRYGRSIADRRTVGVGTIIVLSAP